MPFEVNPRAHLPPATAMSPPCHHHVPNMCMHSLTHERAHTCMHMHMHMHMYMYMVVTWW